MALACRSFQLMGLDVVLMTETRIPLIPELGRGIHPNRIEPYKIHCTYSTHKNQGGLALAVRDDGSERTKHWSVESLVRHGPNVLSCLLITGTQRTPLIGAYLPPSSLDDLPDLEAALQRFPNSKPTLQGDLNVDLTDLTPKRTQEVHALLSAYGLEDMLQHFVQRKHFTHKKTYYQYRKTSDDTYKTIRSRCDYILGTDRRLFQTVQIKDPCNFSSDHLMLVARYLTKPTACHKRYLRGRKRFPLQLPKPPLTKVDTLFQNVKAHCPPPPPNRKTPRPNWISPETTRTNWAK